MIVKLSDLKPGESGVIVNLDDSSPNSERFAELGLVPGERVYFRKVAPLGCPIEIRIMNYDLSLRKSEAQFIEIEKE